MTDMPVLSLTKEEQKAFSALPVALCEKISVIKEDREFMDSPQDFQARQAMAKYESKEMQKLQEGITSAEGTEEILRSVQLAEFSDHDQKEVLFVMGPVFLGRLIVGLLQEAKTPADIQELVQLTTMRTELLTAFLSQES